MANVNKVHILGNLCADPEQKYTTNETPVTNFTIACNEKYTDKSGEKKEHTEFIRIVVWSKLGESCSKYLKKGQQCYVEGKISTRTWDKDGVKQYSTEVIASKVEFLGGKEV